MWSYDLNKSEYVHRHKWCLWSFMSKRFWSPLFWAKTRIASFLLSSILTTHGALLSWNLGSSWQSHNHTAFPQLWVPRRPREACCCRTHPWQLHMLIADGISFSIAFDGSLWQVMSCSNRICHCHSTGGFVSSKQLGSCNIIATSWLHPPKLQSV